MAKSSTSGTCVLLFSLCLFHTEAAKELAQSVTQLDYEHYLPKLDEAGPPTSNEDLAKGVTAQNLDNEEKRPYEPLLHSMRGKRNPEGTLLRYMVGGRSGSDEDGTTGLWKHQSIYKDKRPAHAQLPMLHQLLGYIGKRDMPLDGTHWKLPFGKRDEEADVFEDDTERVKRDYDHVPLLHHYTFGKRSYGPLLHNLPGKRSWNEFPNLPPKTRKYDPGMPVLHQFGFGKRSFRPLLHAMPGKRYDTYKPKRQKEILEHTIDENEHRLFKRYTEKYEVGDMYPVRNYRRKRSLDDIDEKIYAGQEEKRGWGSEKMTVDDLKSGKWFGKRDNEKSNHPIMHQLGWKRSPNLSWDMYTKMREKKFPGFGSKRFSDDIVWGHMYQSLKRSAPMLHQMGGIGKRFGDDLPWDTFMNEQNKANKRFSGDIEWDTLTNEDKRFGDDLKWGTLMNGMKRSDDKRFGDNIVWDTLMNAKRFDDNLAWDTFVNEGRKRFSDNISWDTPIGEGKRVRRKRFADNIAWNKMMGGQKRFGDKITWDTPINSKKRAEKKKFGDEISWDTLTNGLAKNNEKRFSDDISWGTMTNGQKRADKRFGDNIAWDTPVNGKKRAEKEKKYGDNISSETLTNGVAKDNEKRFSDDISWGTMTNGQNRADKRFGDNIAWDTLMNQKRSQIPLLHRNFGKRFGDGIKWDTMLNEVKRNGKRFDDNLVWNSFMNEMKRAFGGFDKDVQWDTLYNKIKRNAPLLHQMFGKRFKDDITWDRFLNEMKKSDSPLLHQNWGKRFGDNVQWDTLLNGEKKSQIPLLHQSFGKKSQMKKSTPMLHQLSGRSSGGNGEKDDKRAVPLLHQMSAVGKKSEEPM